MSVTSLQRYFDGPRPARSGELRAIVATADAVLRAGAGRPGSVATDWPHVYNEANLGNIMIIRSAERVVATVGIWVNEVALGPAVLRVGGINCLATLPEFRRRGLGTQVMEAAHARMRELGCHLGLLSTQIVSWYRKLGWELAGTACTFQFNRSNVRLLPALPPGVTVRLAGAEAVGDIARLRREERLGGLRDAQTFRQVMTRRSLPRIALACQQDTVAAYLIAWDANVVEWGGPAPLVAGLVRAYFEMRDDPRASTSARDEAFRTIVRDQMTLAAPVGGHPFLDLLDTLRIPVNVGYAGMLRLLDPQGILAAFGLNDIYASANEDVVVLHRGDQRCVLPRAQAAKLFFGPERVSDFGADIFPLPFWQWPLEHV